MKMTPKAENRYSAHNSLRPISFYCTAPAAKSVYITGDFNHWKHVPMERRADGWWYAQITLCHGHHQYRFIVDGKPTLDPTASGVGHDEHGGEVSLVAVS
ncbi:MAG TPA: glycogen-binding domain-containing protein [Verrucomicrobiae bacterium]|nr:glycogen-binding domain-containing protein [Verrucomicrobiae bacterium]